MKLFFGNRSDVLDKFYRRLENVLRILWNTN